VALQRATGRHAALAHPGFGLTRQRLCLVVHSGGSQVFDGRADVRQAALQLSGFRLRPRPVAGSLAEPFQHFLGFTFQALHGFRLSCRPRLPRFGFQFGKAAGEDRSVGLAFPPRLQFAELRFESAQMGVQFTRLRVLLGTQGLQLLTDGRRLGLQLRTPLH
jgi:hypothetical protein